MTDALESDMKKKIWDLYAPIYKQAMKADQRIYDFMYDRVPEMIRRKRSLFLQPDAPDAEMCFSGWTVTIGDESPVTKNPGDKITVTADTLAVTDVYIDASRARLTYRLTDGPGILAGSELVFEPAAADALDAAASAGAGRRRCSAVPFSLHPSFHETALRVLYTERSSPFSKDILIV